MSIWGDHDAENLPDDPFRIDENWYKAVAVEVFTKDLDTDEGLAELVIKWKIRQPGGRFDGLPVRDNNKFWKLSTSVMDGEQLQRNAFTKMAISNAFDLTKEEAAKFAPTMGLNKEAYIKIVNNPDKNNPDIVYNNVAQRLCPRLYSERFETVEEGYNPNDMLASM